ncbi:uracil-DNA glycosylase [Flavobacterium ardleyense]|uniref:uracil-DNA glycosylase n=1 Tax=Flavobacterium ardleyense TaxID=2038737 RepID=UPI00298D5D5B|nr:uracil-DNA glycosylase [Flavobacterium ardleyense]
MQLNLSGEWREFLKDEISQNYFQNLMKAVSEEYQKAECYPPKAQIFNAFNYCLPKDVKVVIIGQDPYHGAGEAHGLCFSVNDNVKIPPSLRNIYKELLVDMDSVFFPTSGNLEHWAKQGVLLLNATLSVQKDQANSHKHLEWQKFTDSVIKIISEEKENVVFLLWGGFAQKKAKFINEQKHLILKSGHPSPLSANQGKWFGNKHFSKTNEYLEQTRQSPIRWL